MTANHRAVCLYWNISRGFKTVDIEWSRKFLEEICCQNRCEDAVSSNANREFPQDVDERVMHHVWAHITLISIITGWAWWIYDEKRGRAKNHYFHSYPANDGLIRPGGIFEIPGCIDKKSRCWLRWKEKKTWSQEENEGSRSFLRTLQGLAST